MMVMVIIYLCSCSVESNSVIRCTYALGPLKTSGYQSPVLPTFDDVVNNAIYINRQPRPATPQQLNLSGNRQLLLTFMNFTCNGTMTKLTYIGWIRSLGIDYLHDDVSSWLTTWPYFSLWYQQFHGDYIEESHSGNIIGPSNPNQPGLSISRVENSALVEVNLTTNVAFKEGDILGVRLQRRNNSFTMTRQQTSWNSLHVSVLKQTGGYGVTLVCNRQNGDQCSEMSNKIQEIPYITVETSETCMNKKTNDCIYALLYT